jgi:inositol oxygenase
MKRLCCYILLLLVSFPLAAEDRPLWQNAAAKEEDDYRQFDEDTPQRIKEFYYLNHTRQTVSFVLDKKKQYAKRSVKMSVWQAMELLDSIVDDSDPDISLSQSFHAFQTAEALRRDGMPRWLILTGLIHDLGKVLATFGEPQWAVVGDTFPVGCKPSEKIVFPEYFEDNPDIQNPEYQTLYGIYEPNCGFDKLLMSWGHDEYLYQVMKECLPKEALYIIRFHSFYPAHREDAYQYFMNDFDKEMLPWLKLFSHYDLYSKVDETFDLEDLKSYYRQLVEEFIASELYW